jgi:hypothetical protein
MNLFVISSPTTCPKILVICNDTKPGFSNWNDIFALFCIGFGKMFRILAVLFCSSTFVNKSLIFALKTELPSFPAEIQVLLMT